MREKEDEDIMHGLEGLNKEAKIEKLYRVTAKQVT